MITYNHELYIKQAIEGVLMQKCDFQIELIIGEDCSTDITRAICEEYELKYNQINLLPSKTNIGVMQNFIRTLQACTGKYIALCEGDDYWIDPYKLQKQVDFLEANPEFSICFHEVQVSINNKIIINSNFAVKVPEVTDILELAKFNYINTASVIYRNRLFEKFPDQMNQAPYGDYFLHMLNARFGKIVKINEIMATYRHHENGVHSPKKQSEKNNDFLTQLKLMIPCFEGQVKIALINTLFRVVKLVFIDNEIPIDRKLAIFEIANKFNPNFLKEIFNENDNLKKKLNSSKQAVKTILQSLKHRLTYKFK